MGGALRRILAERGARAGRDCRGGKDGQSWGGSRAPSPFASLILNPNNSLSLCICEVNSQGVFNEKQLKRCFLCRRIQPGYRGETPARLGLAMVSRGRGSTTNGAKSCPSRAPGLCLGACAAFFRCSAPDPGGFCCKNPTKSRRETSPRGLSLI